VVDGKFGSFVVSVNDDSVVLDIDSTRTRRVVHVGKEHPGHVQPSLLGHSVARFEGNVFIIGTIAYSEHPKEWFSVSPQAQPNARSNVSL
jgi:hypothetical protein